MSIRKFFIFLLIIVLSNNIVQAAKESPDVVIIVDTSTSMKEKGMDPERTSLLVSKLLSDVIPGRLSYIRLLDYANDASLFPSKRTGKQEPCTEDSSKICEVIVSSGVSWEKIAYQKGYGLEIRPSIGDENFKKLLESHLEQKSNNSPFSLSFSSARGLLEKSTSDNKYIIWLSDGNTDDEQALLNQIALAKSENIHIEAIVFGAGDTSLAKQASIPFTQSHKPADLMKAFANVFRKIVNAPHSIDNTVDSSPNFDILGNMKEKWVVVYGDDTLEEVSLIKPDGSTMKVDYAAGKLLGAGAYRVAYIKNPEKGSWKLVAKGGGDDIAYGVIQNSSMYPFLEKPSQAFLGTKTLLVASIKMGDQNKNLKDKKILEKSKMFADIEDVKYSLYDNGKEGDKQAGDGLYSGKVIFAKKGKNSVKLILSNNFTQRTKQYNVKAGGYFSYNDSKNPEIDFGKLKNNDEVCRSVTLQAKQKGIVQFELDILQPLPAEHRLTNNLKGKDTALKLSPNQVFKLCLNTGKTAPSSTMINQTLLMLKVAGSSAADQQVIFNISWEVEGLGFIERWWWLLLMILAVILLTFIILGYILPQRFQHTLHIAIGADEEELEEFVPMQLNKMPKVGISFYRNAQAFIYDDFRIIGTGKGASVKISIQKSGDIEIAGINNRILQRKNMQKKWEKVNANSASALRTGEILRIGNTGLYFKLLDK